MLSGTAARIGSQACSGERIARGIPPPLPPLAGFPLRSRAILLCGEMAVRDGQNGFCRLMSHRLRHGAPRTAYWPGQGAHKLLCNKAPLSGHNGLHPMSTTTGCIPTMFASRTFDNALALYYPQPVPRVFLPPIVPHRKELPGSSCSLIRQRSHKLLPGCTPPGVLQQPSQDPLPHHHGIHGLQFPPRVDQQLLHKGTDQWSTRGRIVLLRSILEAC